MPKEAKQEIIDHSVDVIVAGEVLEHNIPLLDTLQFMRSKISDQGKLLITVPTENVLYRLGRKIAGFKRHFHIEHAASINEKVLKNGFCNPKVTKIPLFSPLDIYWLVTYDPC